MAQRRDGSSDTAGDLCITQLDFAGNYVGYMHLTGFGHGVAFGAQGVGSSTYLWTEVDANANGYGARLARFKFTSGTALSNTSSALTKYTPVGHRDRAHLLDRPGQQPPDRPVQRQRRQAHRGLRPRRRHERRLLLVARRLQAAEPADAVADVPGLHGLRPVPVPAHGDVLRRQWRCGEFGDHLRRHEHRRHDRCRARSSPRRARLSTSVSRKASPSIRRSPVRSGCSSASPRAPPETAARTCSTRTHSSE